MTNKQELPTNFQWRIPTWYPDLSPEVLSKFRVLFDELHKFNRTIDLVAPKTLQAADAIHFADSIMASRVIRSSHPSFSEIYDLGSGAGFPGVVFAILFTNVNVHLVEADQKRCEFLKHILSKTNTSNADVICSRMEHLKEGSVKFAIVRGLSSISTVILAMRKIVHRGGIIFHLKGEEWSQEVSGIPIQLCSLWAPGLVGEYRLPVGEIRFSVIKTDKIS